MSGARNDDPPRVRRSTLECFNDELSLLDRPLEDEVEYYDEQPPSRWRGRMVGVMVAVATVVGGGTVLLRVQQSAALAVLVAPPRQEVTKQDPGAAVSSPSVVAIAPIPAATPEPSAPTPEPSAPTVTPAAVSPTSADDSAETQPPPARVAWAKISRSGGHPKHARAGKSHSRAHGRGRRATVD